MRTKLFKKLLCITLTSSILAASASDVAISGLTATELRKIKSLHIFSLKKYEAIDFKKSLGWKINTTQYYFLPVSYKVNQGCKFIFIDETNRTVLSDGAFSFEMCSFIKPPELLDINKDGQLDFRVWMRLPHQAGSSALVNHHLNFIFIPTKSMFCEEDSGIPCN
jgi:hypothetical protein